MFSKGVKQSDELCTERERKTGLLQILGEGKKSARIYGLCHFFSVKF